MKFSIHTQMGKCPRCDGRHHSTVGGRNDLLVNHRRGGARCLFGRGAGSRFEADPVVSVRENFVACDVLSQLQRVMDNPRFLLAGECVPLSAGGRVRIYARRGPYVCVYPHDTIAPCKWTHSKALSK
jgi:hypothetical protein